MTTVGTVAPTRTPWSRLRRLSLWADSASRWSGWSVDMTILLCNLDGFPRAEDCGPRSDPRPHGCGPQGPWRASHAGPMSGDRGQPLGELRSRWVWYLLGLIHAGIIGGFIVMMNAAFLANDREAIHHVRAAWGEENNRPGSPGDCRGGAEGAVAVPGCGADPARGPSAAATVRRAGRCRSPRWSWCGEAAQGALPDVVRTESVEVVPSQGVRAWLRQQRGEPVDKDAARDLIHRLESYREQVAIASGD